MKWSRTWWIDFIEGEIDQRVEAAARMLLRHSTFQSLIVSNLRRTRDLVRRYGDVEVPMERDYHLGLHKKIMSRLDEEVPRTPDATLVQIQKA